MAPAQFVAGWLYGVTNDDKRDYIVAFTQSSPYVNKELGQAYYEYASGHYYAGNTHMVSIQPAW